MHSRFASQSLCTRKESAWRNKRKGEEQSVASACLSLLQVQGGKFRLPSIVKSHSFVRSFVRFVVVVDVVVVVVVDVVVVFSSLFWMPGFTFKRISVN